jgi:hypothetical protein
VQILAKRGTARATTAQAVAALGPHGGDRTEKREQGDNVTLVRGNASAYRKARLKRDAPEVAARLARGEFKNVAQAWRAAQEEGLVRVKRAPTPSSAPCAP